MSAEEMLAQLAESVVSLDSESVRRKAREALEAGVPAFDAISYGLSLGMKRIGELWNDMEIFMPEVMAAVEGYYAGLEILRPHLCLEDRTNYLATAVFGTIYGDVHAVGKNVVIPVFQGEGFNVIDLGIDVPAEAYIRAVKEHGAQVLGLGTYMSETFLHAREVIRQVEEAGFRDQLIILCGGPAADFEAAREMGADGAFRDAWEAVKWTKEAVQSKRLTFEQQAKERARELSAVREEMRLKSQHLREVLARSFRTQEEERRRIAVDTHDGVLQLVIGALYEVQALHAVANSDPLSQKLVPVQALLSEAITEMRRVVRNIHPPLLDQAGLVDVLNFYVSSLADLSGVNCAIETTGEVCRLPYDTELAAFRIIQEALNNVRKHAEASEVKVSLEYAADALRVQVSDDGKGFDQDSNSPIRISHLGLVSMRERAESIGAELVVDSAPGCGTTIALAVPIGTQEGIEEL
jgi:signal transduction histidine kinase